MTDEQKKQIDALRDDGNGYKKIARILDLSENTVKSYCQRRTIGVVVPEKTAENICLYCGVSVKQNPGRKQKKFCSDRCRMKWWNSHLDQVKRKANYEYTCPVCGKKYVVYGNANRKYCSKECYFEDRYGGARA